MGVNWGELFATLGSTAVIVAALAFVARTLIGHLFSRDLETQKAELTKRGELEIAAAKASAESALQQERARFDEALQAQKAQYERQTASMNLELASRAARADRIRQEVVRWANPIFGAVDDLERRLGNILNDDGYLALSPDASGQINPEWSISYDYFLPSTEFLFCQYFCWVRLLEEKLSFEFFEKQKEKDDFFEKVRAVRHTLTAFPLLGLADVPGAGDRQIFALQQRSLGEVVAVSSNGESRCLTYSAFVEKRSDPTFALMLHPLTTFIDRLQPTDARRWRRLQLMAQALKELRTHCETLLQVDSDPQ